MEGRKGRSMEGRKGAAAWKEERAQQHGRKKGRSLELRAHAPRMMRNWRARERPSSSQARPLDFSWGTTSVRMGTLGRYLATRLAVRPVPA